MGFEAKYTAPLVGVSSAANRCSKVLFPAPDGATIATISPRRKLRLASVNTVKDRAPTPYVFLKLRASSITCASRKPLALATPTYCPGLASEFILSPHPHAGYSCAFPSVRCRKGNYSAVPGPRERIAVTHPLPILSGDAFSRTG